MALAILAAARRVRRVEVTGASMEPTLAEGDRLVVVAGIPAGTGAVMAVRDPRWPDGRLLVKRVAAVGASGIEVRGDNPTASTDSRTFGPVPPDLVEGRVVWRYAPPSRAGRLPRWEGPPRQ